MKLVIVNGGPRLRGWNTAAMLEAAANGARAEGAEVETICLYTLDFKGCRSCFACQRTGAAARCAARDALQPVLDRILEADALLVGSPIYFGDVTGETRAFFERLWFPGLAYDKARTVKYGKRIPVGLIFTMNVPSDAQYAPLFNQISGTMERFFGPTEIVTATDTLQFDDYSRYVSDMFDAEAKRRRHETEFPKDLARAEALGRRLAAEI